MKFDKAFIDTSVILRLLVKDDSAKVRSALALIKTADEKGLTLYLPPIVIFEIVWVLEKVYKYGRGQIREIVEAILNTPQLTIIDEKIFRDALAAYEKKNIKFADAVMGYWGIAEGVNIAYTYDEKDFKRIEGLDVRKP
jgi:predicted nucleic-acid-binding protein